MRSVALTLCATLLLAGCLEEGAAPESSDRNESGLGAPTPDAVEETTSSGQGPADPPLAFRLWEPCETCANVSGDVPTISLFFETGRAVRAHLRPAAAGEALPAEEGPLAALVVSLLATAGRDDLLPTSIHTVPLSEERLAQLRAALADDWRAPETVLDGECERACPSTLGRAVDGAAGRWETLRIEAMPDDEDPAHAPALRLLAAFLEAENAFDIPDSPPAPATPQSIPSAATPPPTAPTPGATQLPSAEWRGQDNEMGSIRAPYSAELPPDGRAPVSARVVLRELYESQDARYYMFALGVENTPLDVAFDSLHRTDTGEELPCYKREGSPSSGIKCFVELADMPPAGTEIVLSGTVGSSRNGTYQVGAIVVPFSATWARVQMTNGLAAELSAGTQVHASAVAPPPSSP